MALPAFSPEPKQVRRFAGAWKQVLPEGKNGELP
jgi:hypothetical protein